MPRKIDLEPSQINQICFLYEEKGWPVTKIAKKYSITPYRVNKTLKENDIDKTKESYISVIFKKVFGNRTLVGKQLQKESYYATNLFTTFPDIRFWKSLDLKEFNCNITSLGFFRLTWNLDKLKIKYKEFNYAVPKSKPESVKVSESKIGEDAKIEKPKSLLNFLKS